MLHLAAQSGALTDAASGVERRDPARLVEGKRMLDPDQVLFRNAMSRVVSAVHIVSTDGLAGLAGITANSVTSVSDHPAIMLACVNKTSHSAPRFLQNGVFCINSLAAEDEALANDFAGRTGLHLDARFGRGLWGKLVTGAPVLNSAVAVFDCKLLDVRDVATHHVLFGQVVAVRHQSGGACLAYHDRRFLTV